ncbi:AMP-binding protein [Sneathiella sp. HT1-7]|uniref:AMP-binding protein n=1 Tax=Sneathiella sp. HT1-7 TaxID=2887192 RepID=UPI001D13DBDC|nr:AMP-binding protein [Sneathiella sp. HT1-7]MCC3306320.1 AMP-binding protein [Sneathiella sp. HT1-7]
MAFTELTFDSALKDRIASEKAGDIRPIFVLEDGTAISPSAFEKMVSASAAWLASRGIIEGDRVAIWLPNKIEWMALLFACARIGAIVGAVNTRYRTAELQHILKSSGAKMLIFEGQNSYTDFHGLISELDFSELPELEMFACIDQDSEQLRPLNKIEIDSFTMDASLPAPDSVGRPDSPILLFTTSGTTNAPKLVVHIQRAVALHANNCAKAMGFDKEGARFLAVMPFCGVFGLSPTLAAIASGAPVYLNTQFNIDLLIRTAKANAITHLFGSDEMYLQIWQKDKEALAHARICGFASFTPGMEDKLRQMATSGVPLVGLYGASELHAILSTQPLSLPIDQRLQGGGKFASELTEIRVRNTEIGDLCATNEVGVMEFRAPTNFIGYFRNKEATSKAIDEEGFFHSNDVGYVRDDGTYVYMARNGDFLRLSGFLTDPKEIEEVIEQNDSVEKCQVVGIEFEGKTRPVAFVIGTDAARPPNEEDVISNAKSSLAHYKVPLRVIVVDAFPTTESANGLKIQKTKLRDQAIRYFQENLPKS